MFSLRGKTSLAAVALTSSVCASASAYVGMTVDGNLVRWWESELTFELGATTAEEVDAAAMPDIMVDLFDQWTAAPCGLVPEVTYAGPSTSLVSTDKASQGANVLLFARTRAEWDATGQGRLTLAVTLVGRTPDGRIGDADFVINDIDHKFTLADAASPGEVPLKNVMLHEAGHFFGVDHSKDNDAIMFASFDGSHGGLTQDDIDGICAQYTGVPEIPKKDDGGGCAGGAASVLGLAGLALYRRRHARA